MGCGTPSVQDRQRLILDRISVLRDEFNGSRFEAIYQRTDPRWHDDLTRLHWLDGLGRLRTSAGLWRSFKMDSVMRLPGAPLSMLVSGSALFDGGVYHLDSYWNLDRGVADLYLLDFEHAGQQTGIPVTVKPPPRNLGDPLVPRPRGFLIPLRRLSAA